MSGIAERQRTTLRRVVPPPPLENGDRLGPAEFLRRYEGNAELKKAELIEGIVCRPGPVSAEHARPDNLLQTWLGLYSAATSGVECYTNATTLLGPRNVAQPDACLCLTPQAKVLSHLQRGLSSTAHRVFVRSLR